MIRALSAALAAGVSIDVVSGNHDAELIRPAVRERLCRETGITRFGTVEDVADLVTFMVSARASWLQGATIDLDGGEIPVL